MMNEKSFNRREILNYTSIGGVALGTLVHPIGAEVNTSGTCSDGPVISPNGNYEGTLKSPDDENFLRVELNHGEYISVSVSVPPDAGNPVLNHLGDLTLRNGSSLDSLTSSRAYLVPGMEGSYELWAESDNVICLRMIDNDPDAGYSYNWEVDFTKHTSASPDEWSGTICSDGPVIDETNTNEGTLVSPDDVHYFRLEMDHGEKLPINVSVPSNAGNPRLTHYGDFTLRNGSSLRSLSGHRAYLEPGIGGSYELWAESDNVICVVIEDTDVDANYPYSWEINFEDEDVTDSASFDIEELSPDHISAEPGEQIEVEVDITNTGDTTGTAKIEYIYQDNHVYDATEQTLNAGQSTTLTYDLVTPGTAGEYSYTIRTDDDEATGILDVGEDQDSSEVELTVDAPTTVEKDEDAEIEVIVDNDSDVSTTVEELITFDNGPYHSDEKDLEPNRASAGLIILDTSQVGAYEWEITAGEKKETGLTEVVDSTSPAQFTFEATVPGEVIEENHLEAEVYIENEGGKQGAADWEIEIANDTKDGRIELESNESETVTHSIEPQGESVEWEVTVNGVTETGVADLVTSSDSSDEDIADETDETDDNNNTNGDIDDIPGFGIPSALVSLSGVGYLLKKRLKNVDNTKD